MSPITPHSYYQENFILSWPDPTTHPHHIHAKAAEAFTKLQSTFRQPEAISSAPGHLPDQPDDIVLFPVIQAGQFGIREEEAVLTTLFQSVLSDNHNSLVDSKPSSGSPSGSGNENQHMHVDLTSGYFGLYRPYQDLIMKCHSIACSVVAASPKVSECHFTFMNDVA